MKIGYMDLSFPLRVAVILAYLAGIGYMIFLQGIFLP